MSDGPQLVPPDGVYNPCPPGLLPAEPIVLFTDQMETYLRGLARGLSEYLETTVSAALESTTQLSCAQFLGEAQDVCRVILDMEGGRGQAFLGLSSGLVSRILGVLLVIPSDAQTPPRDSVTDIEFHVMHRFFETLTDELRNAWEAIHLSFDVRPLGGQSNDKPMEATEDPLLVMNCRIKFGGGEEAFRLAVPALVVRLVALDREREIAQTPTVAPYPGVLDAARLASLELEAVLAGSTLRMSDLLSMQPGEILMLGQTVGAPVECRINGKVKFRGELVQTATRRAMQIA